MLNLARVKLEEVNYPERFIVNENYLQKATKFATDKIMEVMPNFVHKFPTACSKDLNYLSLNEPSDFMGSNWTDGFWTGELWTAYELTGNELYRAVAEAQYDDWNKRMEDYNQLNHHDIGFLYIPSAVAQYKITGSKKARDLALKAANVLARRYSEGARIIQVRDRNPQGEFIIDCTMNIPLLFWAAKETGDRRYFTKALNHIHRMTECMIREDSSTYQCYKIDEITGEAIRGWTGQGYSDNSCWARGHSWAIYGLAIAYTYVLEPEYLEMAKRVANYFLNRLPDDTICNWDLIFTDNTNQRDTSTAPIVACALLEIAKHLPAEDKHKEIYQNAANAMIYNLDKTYTTKGLNSNGLLQHAVYSFGRGGHDECCIWGDYYYTEALLRLNKPDWNCYW